MSKSMTERDFEAWLAQTIEITNSEDDVDIDQPMSVRSFEESGVMTTNRGLAIQLDDGQEFQVTIIKSKEARK